MTMTTIFFQQSSVSMLQESNTYDWHYGDRAEICQMNKMQDMFVVTHTHTHTHTHSDTLVALQCKTKISWEVLLYDQIVHFDLIEKSAFVRDLCHSGWFRSTVGVPLFMVVRKLLCNPPLRLTTVTSPVLMWQMRLMPMLQLLPAYKTPCAKFLISVRLLILSGCVRSSPNLKVLHASMPKGQQSGAFKSPTPILCPAGMVPCQLLLEREKYLVDHADFAHTNRRDIANRVRCVRSSMSWPDKSGATTV